MGFLVKLDSNGSRPEKLQPIIKQKLVDYLAMDIKAPLSKYAQIVGWRAPAYKLRQSIELIINSGIEHEFRTTIVKELTSLDDLKKIAETVKGAQKYFLQRFVASKLIDENCRHKSSYEETELKELAKKLEKYVAICQVR